MGKSMEVDVYQRLGKKIDGLNVRAPWSETWHAILKELFTTEEADVVAKMPYTLSTLERIAKVTKVEKTRLQKILESLCKKGLVMDLYHEEHGTYYYMPWPIAIGIFEFTMMRSGDNLNMKRWAELFHDYFGSVYTANFSHGEKISALRVIPIEESIKEDGYTAFFDYEKATSIIEDSPRFALGLCSCRNEKHHLGLKECDAPLNNCSFMGIGADYAIRNNFGREVSKSEMLDNIAQSKELGLVLCSVNTRTKPIALCHCCKCCCNFLGGLNKFGFNNCVITSNFISELKTDLCNGCGRCVAVCPVNALSLVPAQDTKDGKKKKALLNRDICVGCGLCAARCKPGAIHMIPRSSRAIHPESLFEVTMLTSLERGTLQNQLFDNPQSVTQEFMRTFVGAFFRLPPVKRAIMSDMLRSTFLHTAKAIAKLQGKGWMLDL